MQKRRALEQTNNLAMMFNATRGEPRQVKRAVESTQKRLGDG